MASEEENDIGDQARGRYMDEFATALKNLSSAKSVNKTRDLNSDHGGNYSSAIF